MDRIARGQVLLTQNTVAYLIQAGFMASFLDETTSWLIFLTALTLAAALSTWIVAKNKCRSVIWWVSFALLVPLIPLLLVSLLPSLSVRE